MAEDEVLGSAGAAGQTVTVQERELRRLLLDETTFDAAVEEYFSIGGLQPGVEFAPGVQVEPDPATRERGLVGRALLSLVNDILTRRRHARYERMVEEHPTIPRVVAEGDSWFLHPLIPDVIDQLTSGSEPRLAIKSYAAAGDTLASMWRTNEVLAAAERENAAAILLSGGGNDVLGDQFPAFLNAWSPDDGTGPARLLNENFEKKVGHLASLYEQIALEARRRLPATLLVVHGYDYVLPGVEKPDRSLHQNPGKWLGRHLTAAGITEQGEREDVLRHLLDRFSDEVLGPIVSLRNVAYADTRGAVGVHEWADEIHPTADGFNAVAARILRTVEDRL
ncbi:MAG: hypothetical protein AAGA90_22040 [Actinomycetota bacterium]